MFQIRTILTAACVVFTANLPAMAQMSAQPVYGESCGPSPAVVIDGETYRLTPLPAVRRVSNATLYTVDLALPRPIPAAAYGITASFTGRYGVLELRTESGMVSGPALAGLTVDVRLDGRIRGNGGCNNFSGGWRLDQGRVEITNLTTTERACFAPAPYEAPLLKALGAAALISDDGQIVQIRDANNQLLVSLTRSEQ